MSATIKQVSPSGAAVRELTRSTPICGIYFLCRGEKVIYVGQAVNVEARLAQHEDERIRWFDRFFFIEYPAANLDKAEAEWIKLLRPPTNGRIRYQNCILSLARRACVANPKLSSKAVAKRVAKITGYDIDAVLLVMGVRPVRITGRDPRIYDDSLLLDPMKAFRWAGGYTGIRNRKSPLQICGHNPPMPLD